MASSGTVKSFNCSRGYGFITDGGNQDYFVHRTYIQTSHPFPTLAEGEQVQFDIEMEGENALAKNVTGPGGAEPKGVPCGEIKTFNEQKGFGFISVHGEEQEYFVHVSNITHPQGQALQPGTRVTFEPSVDEKNGKPTAKNVVAMGPKGKGKGKNDGWGQGGDGWGKGGNGWGGGGGGLNPQTQEALMSMMKGLVSVLKGAGKGGGGDTWGGGGKGGDWGKGGGDWGKGGGGDWGKGGGGKGGKSWSPY